MEILKILDFNQIKFMYKKTIEYLNLKMVYTSNVNNLFDLEKYSIKLTNFDIKTQYNYEIQYVEKRKIYNEFLKKLENKNYKDIFTHIDTFYKFYKMNNYKIYVSNNKGQDYIVIKKQKKIIIISGQRDKSRCLSYIIREIVRIDSENNKNIIMHSSCLEINNQNILIVGDSGSGKTTLLFQLLSKTDGKYISNDRTIIDENLRTYSFPLKIRLGVETVDNIESLTSYLAIKNITEVSNGKKIMYPLNIKEWKNQLNSSTIPIKKIIIPEILLKEENKIMEISQDEIKQNLEANCFTPNDPVWKNRWFREDYKNYDETIIKSKEKIIEKLIRNTKKIKLKFNGILDEKDLKKILEV